MSKNVVILRVGSPRGFDLALLVQDVVCKDLQDVIVHRLVLHSECLRFGTTEDGPTRTSWQLA